jgi:hypothetical protein
LSTLLAGRKRSKAVTTRTNNRSLSVLEDYVRSYVPRYPPDILRALTSLAV